LARSLAYKSIAARRCKTSVTGPGCRSERFVPDVVICGKREIWDRMLGEIAEDGRPQLRHTLSSLALVGKELWLESTDQLRED
jgi:hypothetical protein